MSLTVEQSQKILDLRVRMSSNIRDGKPAHEGLTAEDYNEVLDAIRGNRATAVAAGIDKAKKSGSRKKAKTEDAEAVNAGATPSDAKTNPKFAKFRQFNYDK